MTKLDEDLHFMHQPHNVRGEFNDEELSSMMKERCKQYNYSVISRKDVKIN